MRLYKRGPIYWIDLRALGGERESTRCTDKAAAAAVYKRRELELADPRYAAAARTTLGTALERLIADREARGRAGATLTFYASKAGHWTRLLGRDLPLSKVDARAVDGFIAARLAEGADRHTIAKELGTLRATLKVAIRRGEWAGDVAAVLPVAWAPEYKPRRRVLRDRHELQKLVDELPADRGAHVCYVVATAARDAEAQRAERGDIDLGRGVVKVRGTKTELSAASVAIVPWAEPLIRHVLATIPPAKGPLFRRWSNVRRDLAEACERAKIEPVTLNDLRRTHATWLRAAGVDLGLVAGQLRHVDTRMVSRVYGKLDAVTARGAIAAQLGCDAGVPDAGGLGGLSALGGLQIPAESVPRDGIEPPTRGFSILPTRRGKPQKQAERPKLRRVV